MTVAISSDRTRSNGDSPRTFGSNGAGVGGGGDRDMGDPSFVRRAGGGPGGAGGAGGVEPGPPFLGGGLALLGRGPRRRAEAVDLAADDLEADAGLGHDLLLVVQQG